MPRSAYLSTSFDTQLISQQWCIASFPFPNSLMREHNATLEKHLSQVAKTQFVA
jgi:hypothetical protein